MCPSSSSPNPSPKPDPKPLGQYLVEAKLLTPAHIEVALYDQRERGHRLGDILAMRGWVKEEIIEWIVQNKLLPERTIKEEDFDTVLLSLKEVLEYREQQDTDAHKPTYSPGAETTGDPSETAILEIQPRKLPNPPLNPRLADPADRETLIMDLDDFVP